MKRSLLITLLLNTAMLICAANPLFQYASESVLRTGNWVKISVEQTGVHKLTYQDLQGMGFANPQNIKVFGYGGAPLNEHFNQSARVADDLPEIPIFMETGTDGVFGPDDYILFYAQGPIKVTYNPSTRSYAHTPNPYSTKGYYFLTTQDTPGKRITLQPAEEAEETIKIDKTYNFFLHEKDKVNLLESGREWWGEKLTVTDNTFSHTFHIPHITPDNVYLHTVCVGQGEGMHKIQVTIADKDYGMYIYTSSNSHIVGAKGTIKYQVLHKGDEDFTLTYTYQPPFSNANAYIDFIALSAYQHLRMDTSHLQVFYPFQLAYNTAATYGLATTQSSVKIWEITHPLQVTEVPCKQTSDSLFFTALHQEERTFLAVKTDADFPKPAFVEKVKNQNLHGWGAVDMVIIAEPALYNEAERLAQFHRTHDGYNVQTVTPSLIYNEFSSGTPDATAYRWLLKMLYDRATSESARPKHLLFVGLAYYDNKGILHDVPQLLSYQSKESLNETASYITDDYFAQLEDNEGNYIENGTMDIGVGRLPVATVQEAKQVVDKTIRYVTQSQLGEWRNSFVFLADDGDANIHAQQANALADTLSALSPSYKAHKIWFDAYPIEQSASGSTYPQAREELFRRLDEGTLVFTYVGHGSPNSLSSELIVTKGDITYMNNTNLPLWLTATCDFSRYDNYERSAGMEVILNPVGGGVALFTTTRVVYSANNNNLAQAAFHEIIPQEGGYKPTLGEVVRKAKTRLKNDVNKLNFSLLGDPAISLHYPQRKVVTDQINQVSPAEATLPALELVTIKASVRDAQNQVETDYQGMAHITLYDKAELLHTLSGKGNAPFEYTNYQSVLFKGQVEIVNGYMEFTFMMPKDINYALGPGRLVYYITPNEGDMDGHGSNHDLQIGGTSPSVTPSQEGPVARIYLNSPGFVSGQKVNNTPVFYAHLYDEYGINTVGTGIGHDITLRLSNQPQKNVVLNDFYQSSMNSYKNGVVRYPIPQLEPGQYTLEFKAWNLQNVSTTQSLTFVVEDGLKPAIETFSIYPNPVKDQATLSLQYDRPGDVGNITFFVYDLAGQLCWQSSEVLQTQDALYTTTLHVNQGQGMSLKPGIYLASVRITTSEGTTNQITKKIIVLAQ